MYVCIFIDSPRVTRLPSRIYILRINTFLSSVFTISFPFYVFLIITSYITLYLSFYLILLAPPRLARHARFPSYCLSYILSYFLPYPTFLRTPRHATHASLALFLLFPSPYVLYLFSMYITTRRGKYSNVLQTHIEIVGQVRILLFLFRYS